MPNSESYYSMIFHVFPYVCCRLVDRFCLHDGCAWSNLAAQLHSQALLKAVIMCLEIFDDTNFRPEMLHLRQQQGGMINLLHSECCP